MLILNNISISRGDLVIADKANLRLEKGKTYTILGPNGAGKSTLLKTIFGEVPFKGDIHYLDMPLSLKHLLKWRKPIGYMPQDTVVEASLTVLEVVLLGRLDALHMHVGDELLTEAAKMLDMLGIAHLAHRDVMRLSGGQRQLVMFAQVLLRQPEILLLDEPVSALDMHHQLNLLEHVCAYTKANHVITVMILHDLSLAAQFSDEIILLGKNNVQAQGHAEEVLTAKIISDLYNVDIEILKDSLGLPVIRPMRKLT
ncbi:peptide ABC transporter substrate-binding protein [Pelistega indica]|uniref:Peptide ABC transporter substrate-binding protein n=1 Tax=Pelistega indica TaxID=1414851 RepID=V8G9W3_9BURK|nr:MULTISPECIES: ABC transporter ATP-binding protein [Pelistega]ETD72906.1 peptide ABC transporter substrate-binding protein [Pelistega indica]